MSDEFDRTQLVNIFVAEATDEMERFWRALHPTEKLYPSVEDIVEYHATGHKLKGAALLYGFSVLGRLGGVLEDLLEQASRFSAEQWPTIIQLLREISASFQVQVRDIGHGGKEDPSVLENFVHRANQFLAVPTVPLPRVTSGEQLAGPSTGNEQELLTETYLIPVLDPEVMSYFAPEAQEYLDILEKHLLHLDGKTEDFDAIHQLFRTAHTLKGSAYTVGFQAIGDLTHSIEDFMGAVRDHRLRILPGHTDLLLRTIDLVRALLRRDPVLLPALRERFAVAAHELKELGKSGGSTEGKLVRGEEESQATVVAEVGEGHEIDSLGSADRKSGEEREVIRVSRDRLERLLNLVGELVIDRGRLEQRLRTLDQLVAQVMTNKMRLVDAVQSFEDKHTYTFQQATKPVDEPGMTAGASIHDFGSLEFDQYDDFNILARRISEVTADISESMSQLNGSIRRAQDDMAQLQQLTLSMRDEIARARMVPIGTSFTRFRRAIWEMARATGKDVTLVTSGEQTEIDTGVVERLVDPLVHLVRNAVYHGIEPASTRVAQGKASVGTVYLHAAHRGSSVVIEVEDDGGGLELRKIKSRAVEKGLIRQEVAAALPDSEAIKFIFLPGFSTAETVDNQAGRGVGMDVVKRAIEAMNGHIEVESVKSFGTKFALHLPLTLLIATALLVRVGNERYAIPLPSVREVTIPTGSAMQVVTGRSVMQLGEEAIDVCPLDKLLRREAGIADHGKSVVIVRTSTGPLGCAVDELLGRQEIVIKSLGRLKLFERAVFGGAAIDPEGRVVLVLDVNRLTAQPSCESPTGESDDTRLSATTLMDVGMPSVQSTPGFPLLLIDDSLSIRKFVGRMLESAGYAVDTASDGEEGCRKAATQQYQLIITDLEMPRLNGYEVIQALRARPQTQTTPILVMTTRAGDKHRHMAMAAGASGYIAKPVEERALIQEIQRWTGRAMNVGK